MAGGGPSFPPVRDGKVVYASTSYGLSKEYTLEEFKKVIVDLATKLSPTHIDANVPTPADFDRLLRRTLDGR